MLLLEVQGFEGPARICSASFTPQILNMSFSNVKILLETLCSPLIQHCCSSCGQHTFQVETIVVGSLIQRSMVISLLACILYKISKALQENL